MPTVTVELGKRSHRWLVRRARLEGVSPADYLLRLLLAARKHFGEERRRGAEELNRGGQMLVEFSAFIDPAPAPLGALAAPALSLETQEVDQHAFDQARHGHTPLLGEALYQFEHSKIDGDRSLRLGHELERTPTAPNGKNGHAHGNGTNGTNGHTLELADVLAQLERELAGSAHAAKDERAEDRDQDSPEGAAVAALLARDP